MGLRLTVPGVVFSRYVDIVDYPIRTDLTSLFYLGTDSVSSKVNHGSGANAVGGANLAFNTGYAAFTGGHTDANNCLVTTDLDNASSDLTLIALVQRVDSGNRCILGAYNGVSNGASLENAAAYTGTGSLIGASYAKARPDNKFFFQAATWDGTTVIPYTGIDGELVAGTPATAVRVGSSNAMRIGGGYASGAWNGVVNISAVAKHTRALTTEELSEVYAYFKSRAVKLGLSVS